MRRRDDRGHGVVRHAIEQGYLDSGEFYTVPGFATWEAADEGRRSVYNAARHLGVSLSSRAETDISGDQEAGFTLRFRVFPKNAGRRHVIQASGGDPAQLAYNPFARAERPPVDENGAPGT